MREVLFPRLIRLRADDELAHELVEAARQDKVRLSEFARCELRTPPLPAGPFRAAAPTMMDRDRSIGASSWKRRGAGRAAARSSGYPDEQLFK